MSFDSASVRLRRKAVKQLKQTNAQQLEIETKKMEERIRALKEQMMREKEERERSGGIKWNSSKSGPFVNGKTQQETKRKSPRRDKGPRRIKMLSDEPLSSYVRKSVTVESQNDVANTGLGVCGQCERTRAGLVCIECGENYCTECFKTFHQKGALKRHTVKSFKQDDNNHSSSRNRVPSQTIRSPGITSDLLSMQNGSAAGDERGSLLKGSYNEEESSASFAQALREWRNSQTVKNSNSWVKRTDNIQNETSVGVSCGSSTVTAKLKEVKIEFQENNTLSYMDRLMLKKNRKKPLKSVTKPFRPISGKERKPRLADSYSFSDNNESTGEFGLNYKEMLLNVCSPSRMKTHETGNDGSCLKNQFPHGRNYCRDVKIEEIPVSSDALDETSACIVEEANEGDSFPQSVARPSSQSGRVSIMTLTSTGDFREDAEALTLEDVSSLSSGSPGSESRTPVTQSCDPLPPRRNQTGGKLSVGSNVVTHSGVRVWSAMASYTGLSSFFLSGVKNVFQPAREQTREDPDRAISSQTIVSLGLLNKAVWKPEDSVIISDVTDENSRENSSSENVYQPLPIIQAPESRNNSVTNETVSVVLEEPKNSYTYKLKSDWSQPQDTENSHKIHDFGIVDFLQTGPIPSKGQSDYNLLHRVSTVSPLALSPSPPKLNWSDNESDDDFIEEVVSRAQFREGQLRDKQDQDADDTATLNDLAWELQSTSGNRSPTLEEIECFMATQNALEQGMDQFNRDSIDEDDLGTELEEIDYDCDSIDEVDEERASRMDVAALE